MSSISNFAYMSKAMLGTIKGIITERIVVSMKITFEDIYQLPKVLTYIERADESLRVMGYTNGCSNDCNIFCIGAYIFQ